jgi:hypothetical protein
VYLENLGFYSILSLTRYLSTLLCQRRPNIGSEFLLSLSANKSHPLQDWWKSSKESKFLFPLSSNEELSHGGLMGNLDFYSHMVVMRQHLWVLLLEQYQKN